MSASNKKLENKFIKSLNICVFCAANDWPKKYTSSLSEFSRVLAKRNHQLISGGSNTSLVKYVATIVQSTGGKVIGVALKSLIKGIYEATDEIIMIN
jgi:predicted Rossmann-fold nucleotide-binding protein